LAAAAAAAAADVSPFIDRQSIRSIASSPEDRSTSRQRSMFMRRMRWHVRQWPFNTTPVIVTGAAAAAAAALPGCRCRIRAPLSFPFRDRLLRDDGCPSIA